MEIYILELVEAHHNKKIEFNVRNNKLTFTTGIRNNLRKSIYMKTRNQGELKPIKKTKNKFMSLNQNIGNKSFIFIENIPHEEE